MGKENTRVSIDIRPWVLCFSGLGSRLKKWIQKAETETYLEQNVGDDGIYLVDQLKERIFRKTLQRELPLSHVTGVGFTEDGVSVTRNDLTAFQRGPHILTNGLIRSVLPDTVLHFAEPNKNLLVGKAVERTGKTVQGCTKGQEWI